MNDVKVRICGCGKQFKILVGATPEGCCEECRTPIIEALQKRLEEEIRKTSDRFKELTGPKDG